MKTSVWKGDWPIPKRITLPGLRVRVKIVPQDEVEVLNGCDGMWLYAHGKKSAVLMLDGSLPVPIQRYTVCHELQHIVTDLLDVMVEKFPYDVHPKAYGLLDVIGDAQSNRETTPSDLLVVAGKPLLDLSDGTACVPDVGIPEKVH